LAETASKTGDVGSGIASPTSPISKREAAKIDRPQKELAARGKLRITTHGRKKIKE
jgi:hypothetical protein